MLSSTGWITRVSASPRFLSIISTTITTSSSPEKQKGQQQQHYLSIYRIYIAPLQGNYSGPGKKEALLYLFSFIHSFIHSGHFYSAPSSHLLLRGAPDYSTDTVSEFHAEAHRQP